MHNAAYQNAFLLASLPKRFADKKISLVQRRTEISNFDLEVFCQILMTKCQNTTFKSIEIDGSQLFKQGNGNAAPFFQRNVQGLGPIPTEFLFKRVQEVTIQNIQINAFDHQYSTLDSESALQKITIGHNTMIAQCDTSEKVCLPKVVSFQGPIVR